MKFILAIAASAALISAVDFLAPKKILTTQPTSGSFAPPEILFGSLPNETTPAMQANFALPEDAIEIRPGRYVVADSRGNYVKEVSVGVVRVVAGNGAHPNSLTLKADTPDKGLSPYALAPIHDGYLSFSSNLGGVNFHQLDGEVQYIGRTYEFNGQVRIMNSVKWAVSRSDGVVALDGTEGRNTLVEVDKDGLEPLPTPSRLEGLSVAGFDYCGDDLIVSHNLPDGSAAFYRYSGNGAVHLFTEQRPNSNAIQCVGKDDFFYGARWELKRYKRGERTVISDDFVHIANIRPAFDDAASLIVTDSDAETISRVWFDGQAVMIASSKGQLFSDALIRMQPVSDGILGINPDGVMFKLHPDSGTFDVMFDPAGGGKWGSYLGRHQFVSLRAFYYDETTENLFLASNHAIFRLNTKSGDFGLFAGSEREYGDIDGATEEARFAVIRDLVLHNGYLIVADAWNDKIRSIDLATGEVATLVGSGKNGAIMPTPGCHAATSYNLNRPLAVEVHEGRLIIANSHSHNLVTVRPDGYGAACPYAGNLTPSVDQYGGDFADGLATTALFDGPLNLESTACGLLVSDIWNNAIRLVSDGMVSTVFRDGQSARMVSSTAYVGGSLLFSSGDATVKRFEFCPSS